MSGKEQNWRGATLGMIEEPVAEKKGVILLVDDQPESIFRVKSALEHHFSLRIATRGELALRIAEQGGIDLVLLDVLMPGMDGYEVCCRLQGNPATADLPIVFLTSKEDQEDEIIGLRLGAVDFIRKSGHPWIVQLRCATIVAHRQARKELDRKNMELQQALMVRENMERLFQHDLKGPLTGIIGVPQILMEADNLTEGQRTLLGAMEKSGYAMLEMINRSLDLYKMENGTYPLQPEEFDLLEVLERIVADLKRHVRSKGLDVRIECAERNDPDPSGAFLVIGERMLCHPLFFNLILNAIEASVTPGEIHILLSRGQGEGRIGITNSGEVPEPIRDRFFEKYVTWGKKGGTGLGTYSAWLSARTQKGRIELDTRRPGETSVTVILPMSLVA
ncbi:MAG: response regulator [Magnetococcales bacterium]|nr:response regulator [Magnetococcales bacterium]